MTAPAMKSTTTSSARRDGHPAQWAVLARLLSAEALRSLLITAGVMLVVLVVGSLIARWRGWRLVSMTEPSLVTIEVVADADGVTLIASLFMLPAAVGIAALVMAIVLAARTRVYVATGATRRNVALGHLLTVLVMTACVLLAAVVVLLVVGRGPEGARELLQAGSARDVALLSVRGLGAVVLALTAGSAITVLFLRWPWWVGVGILTLLFVVLPLVTRFLLPEVAEAVTAASARWGWGLAGAVVAAGVYWWLMRRVPVR
ncbi:hypothetical protein [Ornithinimicrobium sufpigmenti]|uniref:hypothetical protein n=1 Tax=Ornithinimicrobium sufpigmenti TaxID=2508882 RepID=UPI001036A033|nr:MULTISPECIES: hypothetical protein [unclassified Ornithinimicrobium]